jgi:hypothetical protein
MNKAFIVAAISVFLASPVFARRHGSRGYGSTHTTKLEVFEGVISDVTAAQQLVTVTGHELLHVTRTHRHRHHYRNRYRYDPYGTVSSSTRKTKSAGTTTKSFRVEPLCKIAVPDKPMGMLSDLQPNDKVSISYSVVTSVGGNTTCTALSITKK